MHRIFYDRKVRRVGTPGPKVIGLDELSVRKGHTYRIIVSDLVRERPIWFGGNDRSEVSMGLFFKELGEKKSRSIRLAVMDMWKAFENSTTAHALRHLGEAMDKVRRSEYARLTGENRKFVKGQRYTLLAHRANLTLDGKRALRLLLKESFGQLWEYRREGWARRFFFKILTCMLPAI